jgi:hypothetical protein
MTGRQAEESGAACGVPLTADDVVLRVQPASDEDNSELADMTRRLRSRLLDLDVEGIDPVIDTLQPKGAKGLEALVGWLTVRLGKEMLRKVIGEVVEWAAHTHNTVEITYNGDSLKVTGVTSAQQERLVNDFLARHASRP